MMVPAVTQSSGRRLTRAGIVLAIVSIAAGGVLYVLSGSTEEETVKKFARAPAGCTTTLEFERSDTFEVYLETAGVLETVGGDCAANGSAYQHADDDAPRVSLTLLDANNGQVEFTPGSGDTYDVGGFSGQAVQQLRIDSPGTYRLTVTSDANDFVIAVGGPFDADSATMKTAAIAVAIGGLVLAFLLLVLGKRAKNATPASVPPIAPMTGPGWGAPQR